jgi:radical SAM protein with 4Fe4S-binding SPASM domain
MTNPYEYGKKKLVKETGNPLAERQQQLLFESKKFCMLPWMHIHAYPTGEAYPCCMTEMKDKIGDTKTQSLEEIWNDKPLRDIRLQMLNEQSVEGCRRCYEQEEAGFFSMRLSSNKHFGHNIHFVDATEEDGSAPMHLTYWDIRFSNLCNLSCRSCGHIFSSNWYDDHVKIYEIEGGKERADDWKSKHSRLYFAGRRPNDIYEQLESHIDELEQVYFAGGEPLIMEEHYRLLKTLVDKKMTHVRLIYNTNFTQMKYKKLNVLDLWPEFKSVSVGASLDAMGPLGEYMRKGTDWSQVEQNREEMLKKCPKVDFYISPTLSVMNAWHLPEFHRNWVDKGFIKPQDLNVNILQDPPHFRIDVLPFQDKVDIQELYLEHIEWLEPQDQLTRATMGFKSAINFMMSADKTDQLIETKRKIELLDQVRNESVEKIIPHLYGALNG